MTTVGLVGLGYWGPNLARVLQQSSRCEFVACCDVDERKLKKTIGQYPTVRPYTSFEHMLASDLDAVVIATSISTHYDLARMALARGKHVFVEKPLCDSSIQADNLVKQASALGRTLMTGHTFVYSPAVVKVKNIIDSGDLGDVRYISFSRVNLGLYQKDVDVIWDLAVHDISILLYWMSGIPVSGHSFGRSCVQSSKNDVAFLWFQFSSGVIASCEVSWLSPQKMRRTCVVGSKRMVVYDDTDPSEKVKIYDKQVIVNQPQTFGEFQLTYRTGDMVSPNLDNSEPLMNEIEHFIDCIETCRPPRTDGQFGANVVRAIELAANNRWTPLAAGMLEPAFVAEPSLKL
jgi:predicted dehydrogenase